jgi:hypothetical protein
MENLYGPRPNKKEASPVKVYQETTLNGERFAILVNESTKEALDAVFYNGRWETDFSHFALKTSADEVAAALDYDGARKAGYRFPDDPEQE